MSVQASTDSLEQTKNVSQQAPGVVVPGAVTGSTPAGQGIAPVDTQIQAYTQPAGTLTSSDASNFLDAKNKELAASAAAAAKLVSPDTANTFLNPDGSYNRVADLTAFQASRDGAASKGQTLSPDEIARARAAGVPVSGDEHGLLAASILAQTANREQIASDTKNDKARLAEQQASEAATGRVGAYRLGNLDTQYGKDFINNIATEQARQREDFGKKVQNLISAADAAWWRGALGVGDDIQKNLNAEITAQKATEKDKLDALTKIQGLENDRVTNMGKNEDFLSKKATQWADAGYTPTQPELDYFDGLYHLTSGSTAIAFRAAANNTKFKDAKDVSDRTKAAAEAANATIEFFDKTGVGGKIQLGNESVFYQGKVAPNVYEGTYTDPTGTYHWTVDKTDPTKMTRVLITDQKIDDHYDRVQADDGSWWAVNKDNPNIKQPLSAGDGTRGYQTSIPDGSKAIFGRSPDDPMAGQCGATQNDANDPSIGKIWGDTVEQKLQVVKGGNPVTGKSWEIPNDKAIVNDTLVIAAGSTGHVARVIDVYNDPKTGKPVYKLFESNVKPPGGKKTSTTSTISSDSPKLLGVARVPTRPELNFGPDSNSAGQTMEQANQSKNWKNGVYTPVASGPTFGGKSASEAFGKGGKDIQSYVAGLKDHSLKLADVPMENRGQVHDLAVSQGWNPAESVSPEFVTAHRSTIDALKDYRLSPSEFNRLPGDMKLQLTDAITSEDPTFDAGNYAARVKFRNDFTSGTMASNILAANTVVNHIADLKTAGDNLKNANSNGFGWGNKKYNDLNLLLKEQSQDPSVVAFKVPFIAVATEMAKVLKGNRASPTNPEIEEQEKNLTAGASPEQVNQYIESTLNTMAGRVGPMRDQYASVMGQDPKDNLLKGHARKSIAELQAKGINFDLEAIDPSTDNSSSSQAAAGNILTITNPKDSTQTYQYDLSDAAQAKEYAAAKAAGWK